MQRAMIAKSTGIKLKTRSVAEAQPRQKNQEKSYSYLNLRALLAWQGILRVCPRILYKYITFIESIKSDTYRRAHGVYGHKNLDPFWRRHKGNGKFRYYTPSQILSNVAKRSYIFRLFVFVNF
jgi:hypothetical protein